MVKMEFKFLNETILSEQHRFKLIIPLFGSLVSWQVCSFLKDGEIPNDYHTFFQFQLSFMVVIYFVYVQELQVDNYFIPSHSIEKKSMIFYPSKTLTVAPPSRILTRNNLYTRSQSERTRMVEPPKMLTFLLHLYYTKCFLELSESF